MVDRPVTLTSEELNQCIRDSHADTKAPDRRGDFLPDPLANRGFVDIRRFEECTTQIRNGRVQANLQAAAAQDVLAESRLDSRLLRALSNEGAGGKLDANDIGLLRDAFQARRIMLAGYRLLNPQQEPAESIPDILLRDTVGEAIRVRGEGKQLTPEGVRKIIDEQGMKRITCKGEGAIGSTVDRAVVERFQRELAERPPVVKEPPAGEEPCPPCKTRAREAEATAAASEVRYGANVDDAQRQAGTNFTIADSLKDRLNNPSFHPQARLIIFQELGRAKPPLDDTQRNSAVLTFIGAIEGRAFDAAQATQAAQDAIAGARRIHRDR